MDSLTVKKVKRWARQKKRLRIKGSMFWAWFNGWVDVIIEENGHFKMNDLTHEFHQKAPDFSKVYKRWRNI